MSWKANPSATKDYNNTSKHQQANVTTQPNPLSRITAATPIYLPSSLEVFTNFGLGVVHRIVASDIVMGCNVDWISSWTDELQPLIDLCSKYTLALVKSHSVT